MEDDLLTAPDDAVFQMMEPTPFQRRVLHGEAEGDISDLFPADQLATLARDVVDDYDRDLAENADWRDKAEKAMKRAAQEDKETKDYPWQNAANVKFPMLTVAALQFNARAYPAIVKGDEAVSVKVVGRDAGRPAYAMGPQGLIEVVNPETGEPVWAVLPGAKMKRAVRVKDYLNTLIFYRMQGWEEDTDQLLAVLPIMGCAFRKVSFVAGIPKVRLLSAFKLVVPSWAMDCETAPRMTEVIDDLATYQVEAKMMAGEYRQVSLVAPDEDRQKPRVILEQHRFEDLDGDGIAEPYIITVDKETCQILRVEANFDREAAMQPGAIKKRCVYYVKYGFFPNPNGSFYPIGFGHLLDQIEQVINSLINQMLDAGTAQIAGGGFVASGLRLQGRGGGTMRFKPGEYKTVEATGSQLRDGIFERTLPNVSPVTFQLLDMMMMAAKDITSVKDVITGDASNNGQVGTTLALIEQSLAQFSAVYKRVYRSLKVEFQMLYDYCGKWGGRPMAEDYLNVLDDMEADFQKDFNGKDFDIRPISDPTNVTKTQKLGQAQFLLGLRGAGLDDAEIHRRALEAADIEDVDKFFPKQQGPDPAQVLAIQQGQADIAATVAKAGKDEADADLKRLEASGKALEAGLQLGVIDDGRGFPDLAGEPGNAMGDGGMPQGI